MPSRALFNGWPLAHGRGGSLPPIALTITGVAGTASVGDTLSFTPTIFGGAAPYTVTATGLPPGRAVQTASTGLTTGAYTTAGSYSATYTVTDSVGATASFVRLVVVSAAVGSSLPNVAYYFDAASSASTSTLAAGSPGIQIDGTSPPSVLAIQDRVSGIALAGAVGKARLMTTGGPNGKPYIANTDGVYDCLAFSASDKAAQAAKFVLPTGQPWSFHAVIMQVATGGSVNDILKITDGTSILSIGANPSSDTTRALKVGLGGSAQIREDLSTVGGSVPAFGTWHILSVVYTGAKIYIFRDGNLTATSAALDFGSFGTISQFEFLNNAKGGLAMFELTTSSPSAAQVNAELSRLSASSLYATAAPATVTVDLSPPTADLTQQFLTTPNYPTQDPPTNQAARSAYDGTATGTAAAPVVAFSGTPLNIMAADFTPSGNVNTRAKLDAIAYYTSINGDPTKVVGAPMDDPTTGQSYARARRYPAGHQYDLHAFTADGLKLGVVGSKNNTVFTSGNCYAGGFRLEPEWRPGSVLEIVFKNGPGHFIWMPFWSYSNTQRSPNNIRDTGGNPITATYNSSTQNWTTPNGANLIVKSTLASNGNSAQGNFQYWEQDFYDFWTTNVFGAGKGLTGALVTYQITGGQYDSPQFKFKPYFAFLANSDGFAANFAAGFEGWRYTGLTGGVNLSDNFHTLTVEWTNDGSNLLRYIFDGKVTAEQYQEYLADSYTDYLGNVKQKGIHLLFGMQAIPSFTTIDGATVGLTAGTKYGPDNATVQQYIAQQMAANPDWMSCWIKSIKVWRGALDTSKLFYPANAWPVFNTPTLSKVRVIPDQSYSITIGNRTTIKEGSTVYTAALSDGTVLSVTGGTLPTDANTITRSWPTGTYLIDITETPQPTATNGLTLAFGGRPKTTRITLVSTAAAANDLQPQSPNNLAASQVAAGNASGMVFTTGQPSPDGGNNAFSLLADTSNFHRIHLTRNAGNSTALVPGQTYTFQFYAKSVGGHQWLFLNKLVAGTGPLLAVDILNGAVGALGASPNAPASATVTAVTGYTGWFKVVVTFVAASGINYMDGYLNLNSSNAATDQNFTGDGTKGILLWDTAHF